MNDITVAMVNATGLRLSGMRELWLSEISVSGVYTVSKAIYRIQGRDSCPNVVEASSQIAGIRDTISRDQVP